TTSSTKAGQEIVKRFGERGRFPMHDSHVKRKPTQASPLSRPNHIDHLGNTLIIATLGAVDDVYL
ncbi:MAG TPA: hypothetical protein VFA32_03930, partial [Dehalococcoidia bacterium]|nr:hypothetical protein [Dehalococcoidia bacterium]